MYNLGVAYATHIPPKTRMMSDMRHLSHLWWFSGLFIRVIWNTIGQAISVHKSPSPPICPTQKQPQQLQGAYDNYYVCSPLPLRFAVLHFNPKGLFIFKNRCFWPILASTESSKRGPFTSFEAILVSLLRHVSPNPLPSVKTGGVASARRSDQLWPPKSVAVAAPAVTCGNPEPL